MEPNGGKRETTGGGTKERGSDGKRRRERDGLVLVIGVDGRKKYNTGARERKRDRGGYGQDAWPG